MQRPIGAITLDLDDTLWPIDRVIERAESILHEWFKIHAPGVADALPPVRFAAYRRSLALERPSIAHDFTMLRREAIRRALARYGADPGLAETAMKVFLAARNEVELYPDALEALERLSARYRVVSLSNGNADLERIGLARYFTAILSARAIGVAKPDRRIFQAACDALALAPEDILHVGDDPELDVRGALAAGMRSVWVNRDGKAWAGAAVEMLEVRDLLGLCRQLGV
jgi:putative hydrolase of the HAD superfamily